MTVTAPTPARAADFGIDALAALLAAAPRTPQAFTEERRLPYLDAPLVLEGRLASPSPERLEKHVTAPVPESFVLDGSQVEVTDAGGEVQRFSTSDHPMLRALASGLRQVLAGDLDAVRRSYSVGLTGTAEAWTLTLYPREADLERVLEHVVLSGSGGAIGRIETLERDGAQSVMTLRPLP